MYRITLPAGVDVERDNGHALFVRESDGALVRRINDPAELVSAE